MRSVLNSLKPHFSSSFATDQPKTAFVAPSKNLMRRVRRRKAVPRNLPLPIQLLEDEELLVRLRSTLTGSMDRRVASGSRSSKSIAWPGLDDLDDVEVDTQGDGAEDSVVGLANLVCADG